MVPAMCVCPIAASRSGGRAGVEEWWPRIVEVAGSKGRTARNWGGDPHSGREEQRAGLRRGK
jgi:hypothetical protein